MPHAQVQLHLAAALASTDFTSAAAGASPAITAAANAPLFLLALPAKTDII